MNFFSLLKRWFWPSPGDAVRRAMAQPARRGGFLGAMDSPRFVRGAARLLIGPVEAPWPESIQDVINIGTLNPRYPWIDLGNTDFLDPNWVAPEISWPL